MARYESIYEYESSLLGEGLTVGIVMSRFNQPICEGLLSACVAELRKLGVADCDIEIATVPGALEIPLTLQTMAQSDRFDALIALGAVIRGETYHFEVVSNDSCSAVMEVQDIHCKDLDYNLGALLRWRYTETVKPEIEYVHEALQNPKKTVVIQIAPAVRAALGDAVFARAWATGQAMTMEEATTYALESSQPASA